MPQHVGTTKLSLGQVIADHGRLKLPADEADTASVTLEVDSPEWDGVQFEVTLSDYGTAGLAIRCAGSPLTARRLQAVPLGALVTAAKEILAGFLADWDQLNPGSDHGPQLRRLAAIVDDPEPDDARYARLCQRYIELNAAPGWRKTLADEFNYAESSISILITRLRRRGFLTPVARRQYGGQLTAKAKELLDAPRPTAWDRATDAQRGAALRREAWREAEDAKLLASLRAGDLSASEYRAHLLALSSAAAGLHPRELGYDDEADFAAILRQHNNYTADLQAHLSANDEEMDR